MLAAVLVHIWDVFKPVNSVLLVVVGFALVFGQLHNALDDVLGLEFAELAQVPLQSLLVVHVALLFTCR